MKTTKVTKWAKKLEQTTGPQRKAAICKAIRARVEREMARTAPAKPEPPTEPEPILH